MSVYSTVIVSLASLHFHVHPNCTGVPARHGPAHMDRGPVTGFVLETNGSGAVYLSGDTVWYEGTVAVASRFDVRLAVRFTGAARVPAVGLDHLTMTAAEAAQAARLFANAPIVPLHFQGWRHFSESRAEITQAFADAGISRQLRWLEPGVPTAIFGKQSVGAPAAGPTPP
jgi:L-ascorbate metabolism protein UlaG (beta-lactamase superfamily)